MSFLSMRYRIIVIVSVCISGLFAVYAGYHFFTSYIHADAATAFFVARKPLVWFGLACIVCAFMTYLLVLHIRQSRPVWLWAGVAVVSAILAFFLVFLWMFIVHSNKFFVMSQPALTTDVQVQAYIASLNSQPVCVPTNIFVREITFTNRETVTVLGYVWQKYSVSKHSGITRGFRIPNIIKETIQQVHRHVVGDVEHIIWHFIVEFDNDFEYSHYPLDRQKVIVRLEHAGIHENVLLIPDFTGVDHASDHLDVNYWRVDRTFLTYGPVMRSSLLGFASDNRYSDLNLVIAIERPAFNFLLDGLLPLFIICMLLFVFLLVAHSNASVLVVLNVLGGIFFSLLVAHQRFRSTLPVEAEINYLDGLYFIMYSVVFLIMINLLLLKLSANIQFIHTHENALVRFSYWPCIFLSFIILTLFVFYR